MVLVDEEGLLAMADVERMAGGRFTSPSLRPSFEEFGSAVVRSVGLSPLEVGLREDAGCTGAGGEESADTLVVTDCERCRIEASEVVRRPWLWLLEERWPGVWLRIGRARSNDSSCSSRSVVGEESWIFWERTVLVLDEEGGRALSAMVMVVVELCEGQ
jgi:hypothetical protein